MKHIPFKSEKYYHIYNRGNNKENIFFETKNYIHFLKLMTKYLLPIANIYSYCLLPNHFHFILRIKDDKDLPKNIQIGKTKIHQPFSNMFNAYTKAINKKYNRSGSLFQEHLKRKEITNEDYLRNLIIYVNTNTNHHNIADYKNYVFSSYQALVSNRITKISKKSVIELFDSTDNFNYVLNNKIINTELINELTIED